jgi:hypothetical protein
MLHRFADAKLLDAPAPLVHQAVQDLTRALETLDLNDPQLSACERLCGLMLLNALEVAIHNQNQADWGRYNETFVTLQDDSMSS